MYVLTDNGSFVTFCRITSVKKFLTLFKIHSPKLQCATSYCCFGNYVFLVWLNSEIFTDTNATLKTFGMPTLVNFSLFVLQIKEKWFVQLLLNLFVLLIVPITWSGAHGHNLCLLPTSKNVGLPSKFVGFKSCLSDIRAFIIFSVPKLRFKRRNKTIRWASYCLWLSGQWLKRRVTCGPMVKALSYTGIPSLKSDYLEREQLNKT